MQAGDTDPERWAEALQAELRAQRGDEAPELAVKFVLQTHAHIDHVTGLAATKRAFPDAEVLMHSRAPLFPQRGSSLQSSPETKAEQELTSSILQSVITWPSLCAGSTSPSV